MSYNDWRPEGIAVTKMEKYHRFLDAFLLTRLSEGIDGKACICSVVLNGAIYDNEDLTMTLLIPDRNKDSRDDFVWCLPVERQKWTKWYELSKKFKTTTPMHVRYMSRMEGRKIQTIMLLPVDEQSDDDVMVAAAWLRMVKQYSCRMYVLRAGDEPPLTGAKLINAVAGTDPSLMETMEEPDEPVTKGL